MFINPSLVISACLNPVERKVFINRTRVGEGIVPARFKVVFNKLKELGEWNAPNPLDDVKPFRGSEREMSFLTTEQIRLLLELVAQHEITDMLKIVKICLSTGARWNEAAKLRGSQLSEYKITYTHTRPRRTERYPFLANSTRRYTSQLRPFV